MIPVPSGVQVWIAAGHTDMRRGMNGLSLPVQQGLGRDPLAGDLYVFPGRRGDLIKCVWHDGLGLSLYAKRLERGRFVWPATAGESVVITPAQMGYVLEGIGWRQAVPSSGARRRASLNGSLNLDQPAALWTQPLPVGDVRLEVHCVEQVRARRRKVERRCDGSTSWSVRVRPSPSHVEPIHGSHEPSRPRDVLARGSG